MDSELFNFACLVAVVAAVLLTIFQFTIVGEGKAKNITTLGSFRKKLLNWKGYKLDSDWNVVPGRSFHLPFGIRYVGIRFFSKIDSVVSVKPESMEIRILKAETHPTERIPIDVTFQVFLQVVNFWKLRFGKTPDNPKDAIKKALQALLRGWVSARKYDWVVDCKQSPHAIWDGLPSRPDPEDPSVTLPALAGLKDDLVIKGFETQYGVRVPEDGFQIMDVGFTFEYQELIALREKNKLQAEGMAQKAESLIKRGMATARGENMKAFEAALLDPANTQLRAEYDSRFSEMVHKLLAIESGSYIEAHGGFEASIIAMMGAWEQAKTKAQGGGSGGGGKTRTRTGKPAPTGQPPQGP